MRIRRTNAMAAAGTHSPSSALRLFCRGPGAFARWYRKCTAEPKKPDAHWTEEQFIETLRSGTHLGVGRSVLPPMPWPAYGKMSDEDLRAVYAYLKTLPPIPNMVPQPLPPDDI